VLSLNSQSIKKRIYIAPVEQKFTEAHVTSMHAQKDTTEGDFKTLSVAALQFGRKVVPHRTDVAAERKLR